MSTTYTGLGTTLNVRAAGTNTSVGFNQAVVIVGGYDAASGSANAGEVETVRDNTEAVDLFGEGSELAKQIQLRRANGGGETKAVAVEETSTTQTFSSISDGALDNHPFDPNLHPEHSITVTDDADVELDVEISYAETLSSPDSGAVVNPRTREIFFEATGTYTVEYDYGDYTTAIENAVREDVRKVNVLTEIPEYKQTLADELGSEATDVRMKRGVVGGRPNISVSEIGEYTPDVENQRLIEVAPSRATVDGDEVRTVGAVGSAFSSQPVGESLTYDPIEGFDSLNVEYRPSEAQNFSQVTAIADTHEIAEGVTTSAEEAFSDVYKVEIIDMVAQGLFEIGKEYGGGPNTEDDRKNLKTDTKNLLGQYASRRPPLLHSADGSSPYDVEVGLGDTSEDTVMTVGVDPLDIMKNVEINMNIGTVVTFEGVSV